MRERERDNREGERWERGREGERAVNCQSYQVKKWVNSVRWVLAAGLPAARDESEGER